MAKDNLSGSQHTLTPPSTRSNLAVNQSKFAKKLVQAAISHPASPTPTIPVAPLVRDYNRRGSGSGRHPGYTPHASTGGLNPGPRLGTPEFGAASPKPPAAAAPQPIVPPVSSAPIPPSAPSAPGVVPPMTDELRAGYQEAAKALSPPPAAPLAPPPMLPEVLPGLMGPSWDETKAANPVPPPLTPSSGALGAAPDPSAYSDKEAYMKAFSSYLNKKRAMDSGR